MPSIKVTASAEQVARTWAKTHGYKLVAQGQEAAYRLGLQSQAPVKTIFWSNGPSRHFKIGNEVVAVCHVSEQKLRWPDRPEGTLLRALAVTPPSSMDLSKLRGAFKRLTLSGQETIDVIQKLRDVLLLQTWNHKLQQYAGSIT